MRFLRAFFVLAALAVGLFLFARSSFWSLREIRVEGQEHLTAAEVVALSGLSPGQNLFTIREGEVRARLVLHPRVKAVDLHYHLPDAVVIVITEREPVGVLAVADALWEIDAEGVLLGRKLSWTQDDPPLLTGARLPPEMLLPGRQVSGPEVENLLAVARALPSEMRRVVREIHFDRQAGLSLYTNREARVYLGQPEELEEKLVLFWAVYQQHEQDGSSSRLAYVDVSRPKAPTLKYRAEGE